MMIKNSLKAFLVFVGLCLAGAAPAPVVAKKPGSDCSLNGHKLYGKVKVVTSFPDIKVQIVTSFPELKVKTVTSFPDSCGKWEFVESFPDFTIQYVTSFPDLKIEHVTSFPGAP